MDLGGSQDAENPLTAAANSVAGAARTASISARRAVGMQVPVEEQTIEEQVCEMCPTMPRSSRRHCLNLLLRARVHPRDLRHAHR